MADRHLTLLPDQAAAEQFARLLAGRQPAAGCPLHAELVPGLTAALHAQWTLVDAQLRALVPDTTYEIWLAPLRLHYFGELEVRVAAPPTITTWIGDRFGRVLEQAVADVAGGPRRVVVELCDACTPSGGVR